MPVACGSYTALSKTGSVDGKYAVPSSSTSFRMFAAIFLNAERRWFESTQGVNAPCSSVGRVSAQRIHPVYFKLKKAAASAYSAESAAKFAAMGKLRCRV